MSETDIETATDPAAVEPDGAFVINEELLERFAEAAERRDKEWLSGAFKAMHPADVADVLEQLPRGLGLDVVGLLGGDLAAEVLAELSDDIRYDALELLTDHTLAEAVQELDSDDAAIVIDELDDDRAARVLEQISASDRAAIETSLQFDEETAGRLMQRDFVAAPEFWTVGQAIDHMRRNADHLPEPFFEIYLVDPAFHLKGAVPLSDIICSAREVLLNDLKVDLSAAVKPDLDQEEVAYIFQQYNLASAPVVDEDGRLTGMITIDDMVDVIQMENKEDLLALSGVNEGSASQSTLDAVRARAPWLAVNLVTTFVASGVISLFENVLQQVVALAVLLPVVSALSGNAGSQALAVTVRAIAERDLVGPSVNRAIRRELLTALVNGLIFGAGVAIFTFVWFRNPQLSGVIGVAMWATFVWAGTAGVLVPLTLRRLGADPAVASSVFVLTSVDIIGFCAFLGLASMVLL